MVCPWGMERYQGRWMVVQALKGDFWEFGFWISWFAFIILIGEPFAMLCDFSRGDMNKHQLTPERAPDIRPKKWFHLSFVCWTSELTGVCYKNKTTATTITKNMDEGLLAAAWVRNIGEGFFIEVWQLHQQTHRSMSDDKGRILGVLWTICRQLHHWKASSSTSAIHLLRERLCESFKHLVNSIGSLGSFIPSPLQPR